VPIKSVTAPLVGPEVPVVIAARAMMPPPELVEYVDQRRLRLVLLFVRLAAGFLRGGFASIFGCQSPNVAPVGSLMMLNQPYCPATITSRWIVAPRPRAFSVTAVMSSVTM